MMTRNDELIQIWLYENSDQVGYTTSISMDKLKNILSRIRDIEFRINSQNIFFDATDSFALIKKR